MSYGRVGTGRGGLRVVDGGNVLVETIGNFFVQDGPHDVHRVRFYPPERLYVTPDYAAHLVKGNAAVVVEEPEPEPKRKGKAKEDKARRPVEDKAD